MDITTSEINQIPWFKVDYLKKYKYGELVNFSM